MALKKDLANMMAHNYDINIGLLKVCASGTVYL